MITLLGKANSRASRNIWALLEAGADYQHDPIDYRKGEAKTDAFTAINPGAKIPALTDGDVAMFESLAMNLYIAQTYGKGSLWPDDSAGQALCLQWTLFAATELEPPSVSRLMEFIFKAEPDRDQIKIDAAAEQAKRPIDTLEATLAARKFLAGDAFTIADLNVACVADYLLRTGFDFSPWPKTKAWLEGCLARDANQKTNDIRAKEAAAAA